MHREHTRAGSAAAWAASILVLLAAAGLLLMPAWAATPIDHVFVTPDIAVASCEVATIGRGDHSALAVTLRLP